MNSTLLVLETSGAEASAALWVDGVLAGVKKWESDRRNSAHMFAPLGELLQSLGDRTLNVILIGVGPGSYGGVRAALAVADGVALIHGAKVVSLCSWVSVVPDSGVAWVLSDARRNGWAVGQFENGRLKGEIFIIEGAQMLTWLAARREEACVVLSVESEQVIREAGLEGVVPGAVPSAELLGKAWYGKSPEEVQLLLETKAAPIYVRPPHITESKRPAWMVDRVK